MKCLLCYLSNEHQQYLKLLAHQISNRFEEVLCDYRDSFIAGLNDLVTVDQCENKHALNNEMITCLTDFQFDIISNKQELIKSIFDEVISIYNTFIQNNHIAAYAKFSDYISKRCTRSSIDNPHGFCKPLFRVIPKPSDSWNYNPEDENAYFHIPFSKRFLAGNQRYSISGLPMCYLSSNLQTALNELGLQVDDVNVSVFMPKFSNFYRQGIFDVTNGLVENIKTIITLSMVDSKFEYNSKFDSLHDRIDYYLADYLLYQTLQYPTKPDTKGKFIQEYVLPQILMEYVQNESQWIGVKYQSTKSIGESFDISVFQSNENFCFVVPYDSNNDYSLAFKSNFYIALGYKALNVSIDEYKKQSEEYKSLCKKNSEKGYVMTDYALYNIKMMELIEFEKKRVLAKAISTDVLQIEINIMSKLLQDTKCVLLDPKKYGVAKYEDYKLNTNR